MPALGSDKIRHAASRACGVCLRDGDTRIAMHLDRFDQSPDYNTGDATADALATRGEIGLIT
jgi:hypothetical protein